MVIYLYLIYNSGSIKYIIYYELVKSIKYIKQIINYKFIVFISNWNKLDLKYYNI